MNNCTHPDLKAFTFSDGKTIYMCPAKLPTTHTDNGQGYRPDRVVTTYEPCDYMTEPRQAILMGGKPSAEVKAILREIEDTEKAEAVVERKAGRKARVERPHGVYSKYVIEHCRCAPCTDANRVQAQIRRQRIKDESNG